MRSAAFVSVVAAVVLGATACGAGSAPATAVSAQPEPPPTMIRAASLRPGELVPAPSGEPVLTISGRIRTGNATRTLSFDPATLDRLGLVGVTVYEPWVKRNLQFQGVWLDELLRVAQADPAAQGVHMTALDDYQIDLTMADVAAGGILLATKTGDGSAIPIEDGGPTRIVFVAGNPHGASPEQWIWSLSTIDVR